MASSFESGHDRAGEGPENNLAETTMRLKLSFAAAAIFALFIGGQSQKASAGIAEQCYSFIQGNIPWDYGGSTEWNPDNITNLCGQTTHSAEPGRCFDQVMHGHVDYGGGTDWQWKNAVELCASTSNAGNTISCFTDAVASGTDWHEAIAHCKYAEASPEPGHECYDYVQGHIQWDYGGNSQWNPVNVTTLCGNSTHASEPGSCFDQVMHGGVNWGSGTNWEWKNAIHLCQGTDRAEDRISCFSDAVSSGTAWPQAIDDCVETDGD